MVFRQLTGHLLFFLLTVILVFSYSSLFDSDMQEDPGLGIVDDPTAAVSVPAAVAVPSLLAWLLFCASAYSDSWRVASRDLNLVKFGHITRRPAKGLVACLLAQAPGVLLSLLALFGVRWAITACMLFYLPYLWLFVLVTPFVFAPILFIPAMITPLFSHWGYYNGYRYFSLYHRIVYKDPHRQRKADQLKR